MYRRYATVLLLFTNQMTYRHFASFFFLFFTVEPISIMWTHVWPAEITSKQHVGAPYARGPQAIDDRFAPRGPTTGPPDQQTLVFVGTWVRAKK